MNTDSEAVTKIKEIQDTFLKEVSRIEKERDDKLKALKKGIDQRKIDVILQEIKQ